MTQEQIEFGTEVFLLKRRYKLSEKKIRELRNKYGHCLSLSQYSEFEFDDNYDRGIKIYLDDLVIFDEPKVRAVITGKNSVFGYFAKAHEKWVLDTTTIKLNENAVKTFLISDVAKEFQEFVFEGDIFIYSLNTDVPFEDGFYVAKKETK